MEEARDVLRFILNTVDPLSDKPTIPIPSAEPPFPPAEPPLSPEPPANVNNTQLASSPLTQSEANYILRKFKSYPQSVDEADVLDEIASVMVYVSHIKFMVILISVLIT